MAARSTNRFKQKPAVPFGDFMLPILGVIALGIVVVGIRILWGPGEPKPTVIEQPRPSLSQKVSGNDASASRASLSHGTPQKENVNDSVIAQPLNKKGKTPANEPANEKTAANASAPDQQRVTRVEPKKEPPAGGRQTVVRAGSIDQSKFVVQCGSYTDRGAANSVVTSLQKIGYTAVVRKAEVRGKNYFRVIVAGGADRSLAGEIASNISAAGFPVLVRPND